MYKGSHRTGIGKVSLATVVLHFLGLAALHLLQSGTHLIKEKTKIPFDISIFHIDISSTGY